MSAREFRRVSEHLYCAQRQIVTPLRTPLLRRRRRRRRRRRNADNHRYRNTIRTQQIARRSFTFTFTHFIQHRKCNAMCTFCSDAVSAHTHLEFRHWTSSGALRHGRMCVLSSCVMHYFFPLKKTPLCTVYCILCWTAVYKVCRFESTKISSL